MRVKLGQIKDNFIYEVSKNGTKRLNTLRHEQ
jgi:hypothetical protein